MNNEIQNYKISPIEEIIEEARNGKMYILVDDPDRENEGDLIVPAQMATPDAINFMAKYGRGLICLSMTKQRIEELNLPLMNPSNQKNDLSLRAPRDVPPTPWRPELRGNKQSVPLRDACPSSVRQRRPARRPARHCCDADHTETPCELPNPRGQPFAGYGQEHCGGKHSGP